MRYFFGEYIFKYKNSFAEHQMTILLLVNNIQHLCVINSSNEFRIHTFVNLSACEVTVMSQL